MKQNSGEMARRIETLEKKNEALKVSLREAETAQTSQTVFLANMSHELRTPLNAIINYSEMLLEDCEDDGLDHWADDIGKIHRAGKNLLSWVDEILDLSKIEAGRSELKLTDFTTTSLAKEAVATLEPETEKSGNRLELALAEETGELKADRERVLRVLKLLLRHANQATQKGRIRLEVERENVDGVDWVNFAVSDEGAGISPEVLETLFKEYPPENPDTSSAFGGTALALAICHRFSLVMGGNIQAESELGKGSTFTLRLPADVKSHLAKGHVIRGTNRLLSDLLNLKKIKKSL